MELTNVTSKVLIKQDSKVAYWNAKIDKHIIERINITTCIALIAVYVHYTLQ
jgi:hypothetical protein